MKFLKNFDKEGLNFSQMALREEFSYCKCEILQFLSCIAKISAKIKKDNLREVFETKHIDTSFQVANRAEI